MQTKIKIRAAYPLLPSQQGILVDSLGGESDLYRQQICVKIVEPLAVDALKQNIFKAIEQNEALRTIFDWSEGEPLRIVVDGVKPSISTYAVSNSLPLSAVLTREKRSLKPANEAPPIRFAIIQSANTQLLAITYHHALLDGPSVNILLHQLITGQILAPSPNNAYPEWLKNSVGDTERSIWKTLLATIGRQDGVIARPPKQQEIVQHTRELRPEVHQQIIRKVKLLHTTPAIYIQSAWSVWAKTYFKKESFLYGLVVSTRTPGLTDNIIGPYISTLPWVVSSLPTDFDALVRQTNDQMLGIQIAKHLALGEIVKHTSPLAMRFDSILTITTSPVRDNSLYRVVTTTEKTGYGLSVDIELSDKILVTFSTSFEGMEDAIESFAGFLESQVNSSLYVAVPRRYRETKPRLVKEAPSPHIDPLLLMKLTGETLGLTIENVSPSLTFLGAGGDSISALRLKSRIRAAGYNISVGDILIATSLYDLAGKVHMLDGDASLGSKVNVIPGATRASIYAQYGEIIEDLSLTPPAAQTIIGNYRNGFGQDYHEQAAFWLKDTLDEASMTRALKLLAQELPSLRLLYPVQFPSIQLLTNEPRTQVTFINAGDQTFETFVRTIRSTDWANSFSPERGPLLRVFVAHTNNSGDYLFLSFSALVTDGWSFSAMLERLFRLYAQLLSGTSPVKALDTYFEHSKLLSLPSDRSRNQTQRPKTYEESVSGENFVIGSRLTRKIIRESRESRTTLSEVLLRALSATLASDSFELIEIYENGRDDPSSFKSVGPYSYLSHKIIAGHGKKRAYYVFENYPRDSENRLKNGRVKQFVEYENWRNDLLPPAVDVGFLFDVSNDTISVRIIVRGRRTNHVEYWKRLLITLEREQV